MLFVLVTIREKSEKTTDCGGAGASSSLRTYSENPYVEVYFGDVRTIIFLPTIQQLLLLFLFTVHTTADTSPQITIIVQNGLPDRYGEQWRWYRLVTGPPTDMNRPWVDWSFGGANGGGGGGEIRIICVLCTVLSVCDMGMEPSNQCD